MEMLLWVLCMSLSIVSILLVWKVFLMRKAADEIREQMSERLKTDTNVGIDVSISDSKMRYLAADLNIQLKKLREEQVRYTRGDQELKNSITNISHDLRTPLTAICGYMDLLSQEETSDTVREYLEIIQNRVLALKDLTEELFRYSVILSVDDYTKMEEISVNAALEECIAAYYAALKEANIEPQIDIPQTTIKRQLNQQAFARILSNIISNSIKYSDGDLRIVLEENGKIHFSNYATKLDEVQVGHLFDRFYTVESGKNATGLGLSIAKTLTEAMNGRINAAYKEGRLDITLIFGEKAIY